MASAHSESNRDEKKMDKAIEHLATSWNMTAEESVETDIAFMNDIFHGNYLLLRCLTSLVKTNYLVKLVGGSLYSELMEQKILLQNAKEEKDKTRTLKGSINKFPQMSHQPALISKIGSTMFTGSELKTFKEHTMEKQIEIIFSKLATTSSSPVVTKLYDGIKTYEDLAPIIEQRVTDIDAIRTEWKISHHGTGYFEASVAGVSCNLKKQDGEYLAKFKGPGGSINCAVEDIFDPNSAVGVVLDGRKMSCPGLKAHFENEGLAFPDFDPAS